ncbi:hypothetical protein ACHAW6_008931 [Cyclotella cf. meneghiniana]
MPGLWRHVWHPVTFFLVVDDFIKTVGLRHAEHLKQALEKLYEVSVDWKGELFCGVNLKWDYKQRTVDLSMPMYIPSYIPRNRKTAKNFPLMPGCPSQRSSWSPRAQNMLSTAGNFIKHGQSGGEHQLLTKPGPIGRLIRLELSRKTATSRKLRVAGGGGLQGILWRAT